MTLPHITIVLASFQGAAYLRAQLLSLTAQTHSNWSLIVTDDGSTDETIAIAKRCIPAGNLRIVSGPQAGLAANFLSALRCVPSGSWLAFCDQDDLWKPMKLARAVRHLEGYSSSAFYTSGRTIGDDQARELRDQQRRSVPFPRLLLRGVAAGHTMVLNKHGLRQLRLMQPHRPVPFHDWWASLALLGAGAHWVHDPAPAVIYRQHDANVLGASGGRIGLLLNGTYLGWVKANLRALLDQRHHLTDINLRYVTQASRLLIPHDLRAALQTDKTCPTGKADQSIHAQRVSKIEDGRQPQSAPDWRGDAPRAALLCDRRHSWLYGADAGGIGKN